METIRTAGTRFVDSQGGEVLFHGLNFMSKNKAEGYLPRCGEEDFCWMAEQGFNLLRLGVFWDGVEPEPGVYDLAYLAQLRALAEMSGRHGLFVLLDMHQDLFGLPFGDGAPAWATITDGLPHETGEVWSDAYLQSPAVARALDHFWANDPAADGVGLQAHFAAAWRQVALAFQGCGNLLGFDLLNEPFPGSDAQHILGRMMEACARKTGLGMDALADILSRRDALLALLSDPELFRQITEAAGPLCGAFERKKLRPMVERVWNRLPESARGNILALESSYFSNMAVESGLERLDVPFQAYAPHGYDLVVDTDLQSSFSMERTHRIFAVHRQVQQRLNVPVLVGEWGAFYGSDAADARTMDISRIFEAYGWSDLYWVWEPSMRTQGCPRGLCRGYPQRVGGQLKRYRYDWQSGAFSMEYLSDGSPCRIYLPGRGVREVACPAGEAAIQLT